MPNTPTIAAIILQFCVSQAVADSKQMPRAKASAGSVPTRLRLLGPTSSDVRTKPTMITPLRKNPVINLCERGYELILGKV